MEGITTSTERNNNNNIDNDIEKSNRDDTNTINTITVNTTTSSDAAVYMSIDNSTEENTSAISNINNTSVIMEHTSEVDIFLETHHLSQYKYVLRAEGYEDIEDLCILVYDRRNNDMFCKLIPKSGHRTKLERLLYTVAQQSSPSSPTSAAVVAWEKRKQNESLLSNKIIITPNATTAAEAGDDALDCWAKLLSVKCVHQTLHSDKSSSVGGSISEVCFGSADNVDYVSPTTPIGNDVVNERSYDRNSIPNLNLNNNNNNNNKDYQTPLNSLTSSTPPDHHKTVQSFSLLLSSSPSPEIVLKILVVGKRGCGKTSFIQRFVHDSFSIATRITPGVDFSEKRITFNSLVLRLQFWDVSGQEYTTTISRAYYKNSSAAIVMYDAKDRNSLEKAAEWKADIDSKVTFPNIPLPIPSILVGNKCDDYYYNSSRRSFSNCTHESKSIMHGTNKTMFSEKNMTVTSCTGNDKTVLKFPQEIQEFCNRNHFVGHFFASAKTGYGVVNAVEFLVTAVDKMSPFSSTLEKHQNRLLNFSYPDNSMRSKEAQRGRSISISSSSSPSSLVRDSRVRPQPDVKKRTCWKN